MSPSRLRLLGEKEWLKLLVDPGTEIMLDLQGLQGRFEPGVGWDTKARRITQHLIYFISEGQCGAVVNGKRLLPTVGTLCWIYPGTAFRFFHRPGGKSPVVYRFRFSATRKGTAYGPTGRFRFTTQAWSIFELVRQLILEADRPGALSRWRKQSLISLLSIGVFEAKSMPRSKTRFDDAQRFAISAYVEGKAAGELSPAALAKHLGLSHDYFSRIFRRSYGVAPRTWLLRQRLAHAAILLRESTQRISEIAERLGYQELYLFSRQFRQAYGASPRQWRKSTGLDQR